MCVKLVCLLYVVLFFNKICYFLLHLIWNKAIFAHLMEYFQFFLLHLLALSDVANYGPYITNIIGQHYAAKNSDEGESNSLLKIRGTDVTKTNCQHNGSPPVITPHVTNEPWRLSHSQLQQPVLLLIEHCKNV